MGSGRGGGGIGGLEEVERAVTVLSSSSNPPTPNSGPTLCRILYLCWPLVSSSLSDESQSSTSSSSTFDVRLTGDACVFSSSYASSQLSSC